MEHQYSGMPLSNRKEGAADSHNMGESSMHVAELKKPDPQSYLLYDSFHMTLWKGWNYREKNTSVVARGCRVGGQFSIKEWLWNLGGEGSVLHGTVGVDIQFYAFVKTYRTIHHQEDSIVCNKNIINEDVGGILRWHESWDDSNWSANKPHNHSKVGGKKDPDLGSLRKKVLSRSCEGESKNTYTPTLFCKSQSVHR